MTQIQFIALNRQGAGYVEITYKMSFTLPAIWGTGANPISGLNTIVSSFQGLFAVEVIPVTGTIVTVIETKSVPLDVTLPTIRTQMQNRYTELRNLLDAQVLSVWDSAAGFISVDGGANWVNLNTVTDISNTPNGQSELGITATGAAAAAVTLTIPAVVGKFHSISHISIQAYSTAARTGSATPVLVTSTNIPGNPVWTFATAGAVGTTDTKVVEPDLPIKSLIANTATTIVCPGTTAVIWRVQVYYKTV